MRLPNVSCMPCAASPLRMKLLSELKVIIFWLKMRVTPTCEKIPPLGAFALTYSRCLKSGGYLRSPNPDIPWRSGVSALAISGRVAETNDAAPRRIVSRRVISENLVIGGISNSACFLRVRPQPEYRRHLMYIGYRIVLPPSREKTRGIRQQRCR